MIKWFKKIIDKIKGFKKINWGHRCGSDYYDSALYPENSMIVIRQIIADGIQKLKDFLYWEFDVVESKDGGLWCFHDATKRKTIKRMCPNAPKKLRKKSIYELTSEEIDTLRLLDTNEKIPRASSVIYKLIAVATKPVAVEIKKLMTWDAQERLIRYVDAANKKSDQEFYFIMFKKKFKKMPNNDKFLAECFLRGIRFKIM